LKTKFFITALVLIVVFLTAGCGGPRLNPYATADEQFTYAKKEFDKEHYLKAIQGFQCIIFNFPGATVVDTAQYYLGLSYFGNKEYELAAVEFKRLLTNYPMSAFADQAQYMAGVCYYKNTPSNYALDQEDLKKAIQVLKDFILENPDSPLVEKARADIREGNNKLARKAYENGILYFKMYDYRAAKIYFQYVIDNYTDTDYAPLALYKLSESDYKLSDYGEALEKFSQFKTLYPGHELIPEVDQYIGKITNHMETVNASDES
jgi:outer membrane protein assembly factor BamD